MMSGDPKTFQFIKIDSDGYPILNNTRVTDQNLGQEILKNIRYIPQRFIFKTKINEEEFLIEAHDQPLIVQMVHSSNPITKEGHAEAPKASNTSWELELPYGIRLPLNFENLSLDEWDRFHGFLDLSHSKVLAPRELNKAPTTSPLASASESLKEVPASSNHSPTSPLRDKKSRAPLNNTTEPLKKNLEGLIPFVFSKQAQEQFFNLVDEFDDDGFIIDGKKYFTKNYFSSFQRLHHEKFWSTAYKEAHHQPGWDMNGPNPILKKIIPQLKLPKSRILVLGCGRGHDAYEFAKRGHIVTAVDFSKEAISEANRLYRSKTSLSNSLSFDKKRDLFSEKNKTNDTNQKKFTEENRTKQSEELHRESLMAETDLNLKFIQADVFNLPESLHGKFDIVFEHTLFCAIDPTKRADLVNIWRKCLVSRGHLLGIFFTTHNLAHPPFGGTEWEFNRRLKKHFEFLYWTRWRGDREFISRRSLGSELVVYAQKKD